MKFWGRKSKDKAALWIELVENTDDKFDQSVGKAVLNNWLKDVKFAKRMLKIHGEKILKYAPAETIEALDFEKIDSKVNENNEESKLTK